MRTCPICGAAVPEVHGAAVQVCPRCGAEQPSEPSTPEAREAAPAGVDTGGAAARALRSLVRDYPAWLALYLPLAIVAGGLEVGGLRALEAIGYDGAMPESAALLALVVAIVLTLAALEGGLGAAFLGVGAAVTYQAIRENRKTRPLDGLRILASRGATLLGTGMLFVFILVATLPFVFILVGIVLFALFLHWYVWATAYAALGASAGEAFRKSRDLARRPRMKAYTFLVALAWTAVALATFAETAALVAVFEIESDAAEAAIGAFVRWPLMPVVPALVGALLASAEPVAAAPEPPATRVVRCPSCAAKIDVPKEEGPHKVSCAVCGRTGTVR